MLSIDMPDLSQKVTGFMCTKGLLIPQLVSLPIYAAAMQKHQQRAKVDQTCTPTQGVEI